MVGSLTEPLSLLSLVSLLRQIGEETASRLEHIGNWLWCLRDKERTPTKRKAKKVCAKAVLPWEEARPDKKTRPDPSGGGAEEPSGGDDDGEDRIDSGPNRASEGRGDAPTPPPLHCLVAGGGSEGDSVESEGADTIEGEGSSEFEESDSSDSNEREESAYSEGWVNSEGDVDVEIERKKAKPTSRMRCLSEKVKSWSKTVPSPTMTAHHRHWDSTLEKAAGVI